jgi:hypothetical protein
MVLINLCLVLPVVVFTHHVVAGFAPSVQSAELDKREVRRQRLPGRAAPYPMAAWRVDTVVLIVLGFALIPWSLGRWVISRRGIARARLRLRPVPRPGGVVSTRMR